ncbi:MAG: hypothetical protein L0Z50_42815 [Verrucomicrobiales bacterium]|nr:hypothetical protein [Verrucomicrobiales bacterium]
MNTKSPECWASDPQARALRIEISADRSILLPFDQVSFSELRTDGKEQQLRLVFAMHEVLIRGHMMRRIEKAMQRLELSALVTAPERQRMVIPDGQPVVLEIAVTEARKAERHT